MHVKGATHIEQEVSLRVRTILHVKLDGQSEQTHQDLVEHTSGRAVEEDEEEDASEEEHIKVDIVDLPVLNMDTGEVHKHLIQGEKKLNALEPTST